MYLDVNTNITKRLVLRLINSHGKRKGNWILLPSKLIEDCGPAIYTTLIVFGLQQYIRYHHLCTYSIVVDDLNFNSVLTNTYDLSFYPIVFNRKLQIAQHYD